MIVAVCALATATMAALLSRLRQRQGRQQRHRGTVNGDVAIAYAKRANTLNDEPDRRHAHGARR